MSNKDIYLIGFYYMTPRPGVNTAIKGWMDDKNNIRFQIFTEYSSTYNKGTGNYMEWYPISLNVFLEKFGICETPIPHDMRENVAFSVY